MILHEEYAPITSSVGLIKAHWPIVQRAFVKWESAILLQYGQSLSAKPLKCSLCEAIMRLTPLTSPVCTRYLLLDVGEWTAFFDNGIDGTDAEPFAAVLASDLRTTGLRLTAIPDCVASDLSAGRYGAAIFQVFEGSQHCRRSVACLNDGGRWVFEQFGPPLEFEDTDSYLGQKQSDRFSVNLLQRYARAMGINPFDEATYVQGEGGQVCGTLIEKVGQLPVSLKSEGINEVRKRLGLPGVSWAPE